MTSRYQNLLSLLFFLGTTGAYAQPVPLTEPKDQRFEIPPATIVTVSFTTLAVLQADEKELADFIRTSTAFTVSEEDATAIAKEMKHFQGKYPRATIAVKKSSHTGLAVSALAWVLSSLGVVPALPENVPASTESITDMAKSEDSTPRE